MSYVKKQLAKRIKAFRAEKGWTQEELANRVGTTNATISRWENPEYPDFPNDSNLYALAEIMDAPDLFMAGEVKEARENLEHRSRIRGVTAEMALEAGEYLFIGEHKVEMLPDGDLLVNGSVRIQPPE